MKFLLFVGAICAVVYGASASVSCHNTNQGGDPCLEASDLPSWMENYSGGETCFAFNGANWCFVSTGGSMNPCECSDDSIVCNDDEYCNAAVCGDDHTMCLYTEDAAATACVNAIDRKITSQTVKDAIVDKHNDLRSRVANGEETLGVGGSQPKAANMRKMVWSDDLAEVAQRWTDQCIGGHDTNRRTETYEHVGQNYAMMASSVDNPADWGQFVQNWYDEVADFPPANVGSFSSNGATGDIGHYTQVVWAESHEVGCGYINYLKNGWYTKVLICNYGPAGNFLNNPVYEDTEGDAGSNCPTGTSSENNPDGLCE